MHIGTFIGGLSTYVPYPDTDTVSLPVSDTAGTAVFEAVALVVIPL
jgi:hypothetical protein